MPLANVAKVVAAAALGIWIAEELEKLSWIVIVAVVSAAVDIVSVAAGPTKAILDQGPVVVGYFTVAVTWAGYTYSEAYTALGISDVIFLAPLPGGGAALRAARGVERRGHGRLVPGDASPLAMWWTALPALPLLSVAFLAVNARPAVAEAAAGGAAGGRRLTGRRSPSGRRA